MKKKVLYLITKSNWGGAQRYVYDLATHLDRDRFEPVVALGGTGQLAELLGHAGVRVIHIDALARDISLKKEFAFARELWHILRTESPDILHVNSSKAGGVGTALGRLTRVPRIVFTAHGWAFNEDRPWWQKITVKFLHWLTVLLSHRTIAVSRALVAEMDWPGARQRMHVLNPGRTIGVTYERSKAREHLSTYAPSLANHLRDPWIGVIAELHPIKRHRVLLASVVALVHDHPKLRVVLIGEGELREELLQRIHEADLADHVVLTGAVPEAARFLKAFDIATLPSRSESYGYVLHEAGLAGVPVVATAVGGVLDIITHEKTGLLVPPDDPETLAAALGRLLADREERGRYAAALKDALADRTVEQMTYRTEAMYTL